MKPALLALILCASTATTARRQSRVYIEPSETVDASNSRDKAKHIDFGASLAAALLKKKVNVVVVTDRAKALWTIKSISSQREDSTGTKIAKIAFLGGGGFTKFEGSIQVIDNESTAVLYAYNVKKGNFQSAAEALRQHFSITTWKEYVNDRSVALPGQTYRFKLTLDFHVRATPRSRGHSHD